MQKKGLYIRIKKKIPKKRNNTLWKFLVLAKFINILRFR